MTRKKKSRGFTFDTTVYLPRRGPSPDGSMIGSFQDLVSQLGVNVNAAAVLQPEEIDAHAANQPGGRGRHSDPHPHLSHK